MVPVRLADHDMFMWFHGGGVGHMYMRQVEPWLDATRWGKTWPSLSDREPVSTEPVPPQSIPPIQPTQPSKDDEDIVSDSDDDSSDAGDNVEDNDGEDPDTGDKDQNTHQAHAGYIGSMSGRTSAVT